MNINQSYPILKYKSFFLQKLLDHLNYSVSLSADDWLWSLCFVY